MTNTTTNTTLSTPRAAAAATPWRTAGGALVVVFALALPFGLSDYQTFQVTLAIAYAIALLGLNMLTGISGQISLGHGAFYAVGAYVTAILMDRWDVPYWATLPPSGLPPSEYW